jgi:phosphoserine phosphatase
VTHVATLIVDPAAPILEETHARRAAEVLPGLGELRWLAPGVALDLPFAPGVALDLPFAPGAGEANDHILARLRDALAHEPIDIVVQRSVGRRKRLLVADMDSTLIAQECIDELADALGLREPVAAITARAMRGELAFAPSLRERVALLRGLDLETAFRVIDTRVTLTPGAAVLARTMRAAGAMTVIVSGGFTIFTARVAAALGFEADVANTLEIADGRLTGAVAEPVLDREGKARVLEAFRDARGLAGADTMAVGDGANDLAMIAAAGLGVAFHAKPAVAAAARARIDHGDLTALLYIQGYARTEFVA